MRILSFLFFLIFLSACTPKISPTVNNRDLQSPNKVNMMNDYSDWYDSFLKDGEKKLNADYTSIVSKTMDGKYIKRVFFPDTRTMIHYNEFQDRELMTKVGQEKIWSDLGVLTHEGQYIDGKETGLIKNYHYQTGELLSEGNYRKGKREGLWKFYHSDGRLTNQTKYKNGLKEGEHVSYAEDGEIAAKIEYRSDTIYNSQILKVVDAMNVLNRSEQMPMFGDGCPEKESIEEKKKCSDHKMLVTIYSNLRYPPMAREYGLEGTAYVSFTVNKSGRIEDVFVKRGLNQEITDELYRVVKLLDAWIPGEQDGEPVSVQYTLPVRFKLE